MPCLLRCARRAGSPCTRHAAWEGWALLLRALGTMGHKRHDASCPTWSRSAFALPSKESTPWPTSSNRTRVNSRSPASNRVSTSSKTPSPASSSPARASSRTSSPASPDPRDSPQSTGPPRAGFFACAFHRCMSRAAQPGASRGPTGGVVVCVRAAASPASPARAAWCACRTARRCAQRGVPAVGCETLSSVCPLWALSTWVARSPSETMPTRRLSRSSTGMRRICLSRIRAAAACTDSSA